MRRGRCSDAAPTLRTWLRRDLQVFSDEKACEIVAKSLRETDNACDQAAKALSLAAYQVRGVGLLHGTRHRPMGTPMMTADGDPHPAGRK